MWSVFFVFLSYLDGNLVGGDLLSPAPDAEKESKEMFSVLNGTFCAKASAAGENFIYRVTDGAEAVRSVVTPSGKLVACTVTVDQVQVRSFVHKCRSGVRAQGVARQLETPFTRMEEAKAACRALNEELNEGSARSSRVKGGDDNNDDESAQQHKVLTRSKRGFTYPGTLWCGAGNMADHYDQLGQFAETDSCCRIHDHCPHVIHAFSSNYGHTNFKWHSICHCDCDNALKACLRKVNDTSSRVVGQAFFNVIGVPCFEFTYEEQCAERHWYGLCKRYEKLPVAVLKEAVPYDFGGIDVIDGVTLAPPKMKDSKNRNEAEKPESTTQSTISAPEEPTLTNVVTAAEDFIKVLATVSTSQSSSADSGKGETQSSEKKRRKNTGKKKKKTTKKQKGKGRKRKQKADTDVKTEEGAAVSPSGRKAGEVTNLSNFISESHKHDQSSRNTHRVGDNKYELGGKEEPSNEVMKDEPAMEKDTVSTMSPTKVQNKQAESDVDALMVEVPPSAVTSTSVTLLKEKTRRLRKGRRKSKKLLISSEEELVRNADDKLSRLSVPTVITITPTPQGEQQSFEGDTEMRPLAATANSPAELSKVKRSRSKERGDREGRKKRRKVSSASPIVAAGHEHPPADNLKVIPLTRAPIPTWVSAAGTQVSHRLDFYEGKTAIHATAPNSSFSVWKRQRSTEKGQKRRKTALPLSNQNPFYIDVSENVPPVVTTPGTSGAPNSRVTAAAVSPPTEKLETHSEWRLFTTPAPTISTKRHRPTLRRQRKSRKKAVTAARGDRISVPEQTVQTTVAFTTTPTKAAAAEELGPQRSENPHMTTSVTPVLSPIQLSIERVKAQFTRKKRRKAALSIRRQQD